MKIRNPVFPVASFGTRFLPATMAMPKELLLIVDKPMIKYEAEKAIAAGIDTLIFVTAAVVARLKITLMRIMNWNSCYSPNEKMGRTTCSATLLQLMFSVYLCVRLTKWG